jgi:hypothetical protein
MTRVPELLRAEVEQRAGGRCEYCRLSQVVATLRLNRPLIIEIRREEALRGRHPS